jgi:alcohol dehydrogenase class IV
MSYLFHMPSFLTTGLGSLEQAGERAKKYGKNVLIVSDPVMKKIGLTDRLESILSKEGIQSTLYSNVDTEPLDRHVDEALEQCKTLSPDLIVAIGGGSAIDTGKAVAMMYTNPGHIRDYMGYNKLKAPILPLIAIPTTAGTGSEATKVTVVTDTKNDVKMMLSDPHLMPTEAIVDPELTLTMPKTITASTGVDALTHAIEAFISQRAQPFTDSLALSAIEDISIYLKRSFDSAEDIEARSKVMYGALKAGMAFSNASVCLVHGMSRPIGALFHVPHGVSNAMLLPAVMEYTVDECVEKFAIIAEKMGIDCNGLSEKEAAAKAVEFVKQLCVDLEIPNLKQWGIEKEQYEKVTSKMAEDALASGSPQNNPKVPNQNEIIELYEISYNYNFSVSEVKN